VALAAFNGVITREAFARGISPPRFAPGSRAK
jgi:hypothetical protein